jgi:hypothetical protein
MCLPNELCLKIFIQSSIQDWNHLSQTSKRFNFLIHFFNHHQLVHLNKIGNINFNLMKLKIHQLSIIELNNLKNWKRFYFDYNVSGESNSKILLKKLIRRIDLKKQKCIEEIGTYLINLNKLEQLTYLDLSKCYITDDHLINLKNHLNLTHLILNGCCELTDIGMKHLVKIEKLTHLELNYCTHITAECITYLKDLNRLTYLHFSISYGSIENDHMKNFQSMINLIQLKLSDLENITDDGLEYLKGLNNLTHLKLCNLENVTDDGLKHLNNLFNLIHLDLSYCRKITDTTLINFKDLEKLTEFLFDDCSVTREGVKQLKELFPNLIRYSIISLN